METTLFMVTLLVQMWAALLVNILKITALSVNLVILTVRNVLSLQLTAHHAEFIQQDLDFSLTDISATLFALLGNMDRLLIIVALTVIQVVVDANQLQSTVFFVLQVTSELLVLISALMIVAADIMEIQPLNFVLFVPLVVPHAKTQPSFRVLYVKVLQEFPIISTMAAVYQFVHQDNTLIIVPVIVLALHAHLHVLLALTQPRFVSVVLQVII